MHFISRKIQELEFKSIFFSLIPLLKFNLRNKKVTFNCFSAAPPAADGGAAAAGLRASGKQHRNSTRRQHGRHGGPPREEEANRSEEILHHNFLQVHGEEVQFYLVICRHAHHSQDNHIQQGWRRINLRSSSYTYI